MAGRKAKAANSAVQHPYMMDLVFDQSMSCLAVLDRQLDFVRVNAAYARAWQLSIDDFAGRSHLDLYPPEIHTFLERVVHTKQPAQIRAQPFTFPGQAERGTTYWDWTIAALLDAHDEVEFLLLSLHDVTPHVATDRGPGRAVPLIGAGDTLREAAGIAIDIGDRKNTEEALRESEERFANAFEHAAIGMALVAPDGRWLGVNRSLCALVGYSANELLIRTFQDITHPDDLEADLAYVQQMLAGEIRFYHMEKRYLHKLGHVLWVLLSVSLVRDAQGEPLYFISQIKNISQRKQAEKEQAALIAIASDINRTADFKAMLDLVQRRVADLLPCDRVATYRWDKALRIYSAVAWHGVPDGLVSEISRLGSEPGDDVVERLRAGESVLLGNGDHADSGAARTLEQAHAEAMLLVPLAVYGRQLGVLVAHIEHGGSFNPHQAQLLEGIAQQVGIAMEAYEVNQAQREEALISSALARVGQELIASLAAPNLLDVLCQVTAEVLGCDSSHTLFWQPDDDIFRPIAAYGETPEEQEVVRVIRIPRRMLGGLFPRFEEDDVAEVQAADSNLNITTEQRTGRHLCIALRRGKDTIGIQVASRRNNGEPFGTIELGIGRGIAQLASLTLEHARVRQELEQSNKLKSEFVATMSHELRTPLNIIIGYTDLVADHVLGPLNPEQVDVIQRVGKSARELEELIRATLDMSRLEKGEIPLDIELVQLSELLAEVAAATEHTRHKPGVEMAWEIPADLPSLQTDRVKLKVILRNLLGNALKFTPEGTVKLAVQVRTDGITFAVSDTGIGIGEDSMRIIFEPFRQGDNGVKHRYGGVGLGLYIVRRLVDALGGSVAVDSALGHGSTFRVWLPPAGATRA